MPIWLFIILLTLLVLYIQVRWITKGFDKNKEYPKEVNDRIKSMYSKGSRLILFCFGIIKVDFSYKELDYSKYLGKGYESHVDYNTIIGNHSSYFDVLFMMYKY